MALTLPTRLFFLLKTFLPPGGKDFFMRIWALTGIVGNGRTLRSENRVQANDVAKAKMATMTASGRALSARLPQTGFPCAANGFGQRTLQSKTTEQTTSEIHRGDYS